MNFCPCVHKYTILYPYCSLYQWHYLVIRPIYLQLELMPTIYFPKWLQQFILLPAAFESFCCSLLSHICILLLRIDLNLLALRLSFFSLLVYTCSLSILKTSHFGCMCWNISHVWFAFLLSWWWLWINHSCSCTIYQSFFFLS